MVYARQAFGNPDSVVEYLGQYTHHVAISNARTLKVAGTYATSRWGNRKKGYKTETGTITPNSPNASLTILSLLIFAGYATWGF